MNRKTVLLIVAILLLSSFTHAESVEEQLGDYHSEKGLAVSALFWQAGNLTFKKTIFIGEEIEIEAPLTDFFGEIVSSLEFSSEVNSRYLSTASVDDGGCRYVMNVPSELKYKVLRCMVIFNKQTGPDSTRYTVSFKMTQIPVTSKRPLDKFKIDNNSVIRTVQSVLEDGSLSDPQVLK